MVEVEIFTTRSCPFCVRAKQLLDGKKIKYKEIDVSDNDQLRDSMTKRAGGKRTVPQIFIGETHVGGCDDLYALENSGKLDGLLNQ